MSNGLTQQETISKESIPVLLDPPQVNQLNGQSVEESKITQMNSMFDGIFDANNPQIKHDIIRMILQYLSDNGYTTSTVVLQEEAGMMTRESSNRTPIVKSIRLKIISGDWEGTEAIIREKIDELKQKELIYQIYKQVYLEYISRNEYQKALHYLFKYIKPMEDVCESIQSGEFMELSYLLTVKSIQSSPYFNNWPGVQKAREILADLISRQFIEEKLVLENPIADDRLITLLKQAYCFQAVNLSSHNHITTHRENDDAMTEAVDDDKSTVVTEKLSESCRVYPPVVSLLEDFNLHSIPSILIPCDIRVDGPIKSIIDIGKCHIALTSRSKLLIWDYSSMDNIPISVGSHNGIIWDMTCNSTHTNLITGGADGTVKVWSTELQEDLDTSKQQIPLSLTGHHGDVYAVKSHPYVPHIFISGGYDGTIRLWNFAQERCIKQYTGHSLSVSALAMNPAGNLIFSGGNDRCIQVWDILSVCKVSSLEKNLKEITGLDVSSDGQIIAVANKSNCHYLVDLRTNQIEMSFRGVVNSRSNFLRVHFMGDNFIYSGSENACVCIWDVRTQKLIQCLQTPHGSGPILDCCYNRDNGNIFSGSDRGSLCRWS